MSTFEFKVTSESAIWILTYTPILRGQNFKFSNLILCQFYKNKKYCPFDKKIMKVGNTAHVSTRSNFLPVQNDLQIVDKLQGYISNVSLKAWFESLMNLRVPWNQEWVLFAQLCEGFHRPRKITEKYHKSRTKQNRAQSPIRGKKCYKSENSNFIAQ